MKLSRTNRVLTVALLLLLAVLLRSGVDYSRPNYEILPEMKYTPAAEAFSASKVFRNGRTMQSRVPGTIARGEQPLYYSATKQDAARAGKELRNPYLAMEIKPAKGAGARTPGTINRDRLANSVRQGAKVYRVFCISCHGPKGAGDGPITKRGFPPPPSLLVGKSKQIKDGQLFHILTYGQGTMAAFAAQLSRKERWHVINYVRDLQRSADRASNRRTPPSRTSK